MTPEGEIRVAQTVPGTDPGGAAPGGGLGFFLPLIAFFLLMYALMIRPQQKQQREHKKMIEQIKKGDVVVTTGGLHGRVTGVTEDVVTLEIAERVRVKVNKSAVASRLGPAEGAKT
ncbi:MAG: preprotein translocase subunit YajC [Myxococcota bacterium]